MLAPMSTILGVASLFFSVVAGAGTTVFVTASYCPAPTGISSPALPTTFVLYADASAAPGRRRQAELQEYIGTGAMLTTDIEQALHYTLTLSGQLMVGQQYISSAGLGFEPFAPLSITAHDNTVFSLVDGSLTWKNADFSGGQAQFCLLDSTVEVVFSGLLPNGCASISLEAAAAPEDSSSSTTMSMGTSSFATGSMSTTYSFMSQPTSSSQMSSYSTTMGTMSTSTSGTMITTTTQSPYPAPTSSGAPNCLDRSPYDGTVNYNYLILCATDLQGATLAQNDAANLADCIASCNAYVPSGNGQCVAVEYDTTAILNPCILKSNISTINRGDNQFAQAAVVVNVPYAPHIVFAGVDGTTSSTTLSSSMTSQATSTLSVPSLTTPTLPLSLSISASTLSTTSTPNTQSTTTTSTTSLAVLPTTPLLPTTTLTLPTTTLSLPTLSTPSACGPTPTTTSLCPTYNHQSLDVNSDDYCYTIECSTSLIGTIAYNVSIHIATSLKMCTNFCSLQNIAQTDGCVGVMYTGTDYIEVEIDGSPASENCLIMSEITGTMANGTVDSARLDYFGYVPGSDF